MIVHHKWKSRAFTSEARGSEEIIVRMEGSDITAVQPIGRYHFVWIGRNESHDYKLQHGPMGDDITFREIYEAMLLKEQCEGSYKDG